MAGTRGSSEASVDLEAKSSPQPLPSSGLAGPLGVRRCNFWARVQPVIGRLCTLFKATGPGERSRGCNCDCRSLASNMQAASSFAPTPQLRQVARNAQNPAPAP